MRSQKSMVSLVQEYLDFRRSLGYELYIPGQLLMSFARYADKTGHRGPLTANLIIQWVNLSKGAEPSYLARRFQFVRDFAKYRALSDPATEVPSPGIVGKPERRKPPHIYSDKEIESLLQAASQLIPRNSIRPITFTTLFGLLLSTGLRISEALHLMLKDVDFKAEMLTIRATKFKKNRLVPIHSTTASALRHYARVRNRICPQTTCNSFFLNSRATAVTRKQVHNTFYFLRRKLGWHQEGRARLPRVHDMRHTFVVRRMLAWYEEGIDIDREVAALSTYIGHSRVTHTYWYFTAVPELLAVVGTRFEHFARKVIGGAL